MKWIHQLLLLNKDSGPNTSHLLTLKISPSFTYLGIKIVPQLENIISTNYNVIIESTFKDVERWLPISLIGRINISKMNILAPPAGVFSKINSGNWNKKCPRVRLSLHYLPFDPGGLKCPSLFWYYLAAQHPQIWSFITYEIRISCCLEMSLNLTKCQANFSLRVLK